MNVDMTHYRLPKTPSPRRSGVWRRRNLRALGSGKIGHSRSPPLTVSRFSATPRTLALYPASLTDGDPSPPTRASDVTPVGYLIHRVTGFLPLKRPCGYDRDGPDLEHSSPPETFLSQPVLKSSSLRTEAHSVPGGVLPLSALALSCSAVCSGRLTDHCRYESSRVRRNGKTVRERRRGPTQRHTARPMFGYGARPSSVVKAVSPTVSALEPVSVVLKRRVGGAVEDGLCHKI